MARVSFLLAIICRFPEIRSKKYISLFDALGLNLEDIEQKTDTELEVLFSQSTLESSNPKLEKLHSYFPKMERDLKKVGMTIQHLWEAYYKENPDGLKSSQSL